MFHLVSGDCSIRWGFIWWNSDLIIEGGEQCEEQRGKGPLWWPWVRAPHKAWQGGALRARKLEQVWGNSMSIGTRTMRWWWTTCSNEQNQTGCHEEEPTNEWDVLVSFHFPSNFDMPSAMGQSAAKQSVKSKSKVGRQVWDLGIVQWKLGTEI